MSKLKGTPKTGGRQKGSVNKVTKDIKTAFKSIIDGNLDNVDTWLQRTAKTNPAQAVSLLIQLSEYILPKLARTEVKQEGDAKMIITVVRE